MPADVLIENHGSVAMFTPMTPDAHHWIEENMSRLNRGKGLDVPSPANHDVWSNSLKGCNKTAWWSNRKHWTAPPTVK